MDFVIASKKHHQSDLKSIVNTFSLSSNPDDEIFIHTTQSVVLIAKLPKPQICFTDRWVYLFDGLITKSNGLVMHSSINNYRQTEGKAEKAYQSCGKTSFTDVHESLNRSSEDINGVFSFISIPVERNRANNTIYLWIDFLGNYPVYIHEEGSNFVISNNILINEDIARNARSIYPAIESMVTNGCDTCYTHLENTSKLAAFTSLEIDCNGTLKINSQRTYEKIYEYEDCLKSLNESILNTTGSIANYSKEDTDFQIICDLTGGVDSRTILAFLLSSINKEDISIRTMGTMPNPDFNVANLIVKSLKLKTSSMPIIPAPIDYRWRFNSFLSGGSKMAGDQLSTILTPNLCHFTGGFAEIAGGLTSSDYLNISFRQGGSIKDGINTLIAAKMKQASLTLLTNEAINIVRENLLSYYEALLQKGCPKEDLVYERYVNNRSPLHFGLGAYIKNKTQLAPAIFANQWMYFSGKSLDYEIRRSKKVMFDLIRKSRYPALAFYPLANNKWNKMCANSSYHYLIDKMQLIHSKSEALSEQKALCDYYYPKIARNSKFYKSIVPNLTSKNASTPQIVFSEKAKFLARYFYSITDKRDPVWRLFNRSAVYRASFEESYNDTQRLGIATLTLETFNSAMSWYHRLEKIIPIEGVYKFTV